MFRFNAIDNFNSMFNIFTVLSPFELLSAIVEMLIIAFVIFVILSWLKKTRAWVLFRAIIVVGIIILLSQIFNFEVILFILRSLTSVALIALIIVFQDDIRAGLEHLGRRKIFSKFIPDIKLSKQTTKENIQEIVEASFSMSKVKTGALIVIEQNVSLEEYERTGISICGEITKQLLINIFEKNTPLHDGAVLVVGNEIKAATCYLPLSHNNSISKALGTRHRAAFGISEVSDSIIIVVSEETGNVSLCYEAKLEVMKDEKQLTKAIMDIIYGHEETTNKNKKMLSTVKEWFK